MSVNKAIIIGHLGRDPDTRYFPDGKAVCNLSVATSYSWNDKDSGEKKEETEWHRVVFRGRLAEVAAEYLRKGSHVYIEGRLKTRKYEKDGQDHFSTEIIAERLQMLGGKSQDAEPRTRPEPKAASAPAAKKPAGKFDDMEDDIPF